jgi:hypothetical protein
MLGYLQEYYLRPELHWWGRELPKLRWNLIISMVFGFTFWLRRSSLRPMKSPPNPAIPWLLSLNLLMLFISVTIAANPTLSWSWTIQWIKLAVIFPLLVIGVVRSRGNFNAFAAAHMLGAFWWGWDSWLDPKRKAGRLESVGSGDTQDDNGASAHLLTVLPFIAIYLLTEKDKRLRAIALLAAPFVINTLILCNSRGATLGLAAAMGASLFLIRRGYRIRLAAAVVATAATFFYLADATFINRQQTTAEYKEDSSAIQRLISWQAGWELIKDHPFGTGGRGFHTLSPIYIPEIVDLHGGEQRAPHNTYVMVASEWGIVGTICFVGFISSVFLMLRRIKAKAVAPDQQFFYWRALAIQLSLIGILVAATFTDRLYAEAPYWMAALAGALYRIQATELAEAAEAEKATAQPGAVVGAQPAVETC